MQRSAPRLAWLALPGVLALAGAALWLAPGAERAAGPAARPHVVLVIIDTLRADRLGAYGHPRAVSPEIDRMAERGVRFERAVAASTWTRPSVGALLTSLHPRTLGLYVEREQALAESFTTLAELFRAAGYTTFGATANPNINSYYGFAQGFDAHRDSDVAFPWMPEDAGPRKVGGAVRLPRAGELFRALRERIDSASGGPFYVQVNLMEVHEFHRPEFSYGEPFDRLYADAWPVRERRYLQATRAVSQAVGRFVRELERRPGWEDALFVVTSDHGETILRGEHPAVRGPFTHGFLVYEEQVRVPLVLYTPGGALPAGSVVSAPVRLLDLAPTLLDYAGLEAPSAMAGRSLLPLLRGEGTSLPEAFVVETEFRSADKVALYTPGWKYIVNRDRPAGLPRRELQALGEREDGGRTDRKRAHPETAARLAERLEAWLHAHPRQPPTHPGEEAPEALRRQLRSLGYLE